MEISLGKELEQKVFTITNEKDFASIALKVFEFQFTENAVYHQYCRIVGRRPGNVTTLAEIPFLPISLFITHPVKSTAFEPEVVFKSSGTTGSATSTHFVKDAGVYIESFTRGFRHFYGDVKGKCIIGLLPSYLERSNSSLVYMVDHLIKESGHLESGFYMHGFAKLDAVLRRLEQQQQETILIGVTYALLDFCEKYPQQLRHTTVMETGGMKGRGREMTKAELNAQLRSGFGVPHVHSEYGMTELLSQAYGIDGVMKCPPWMRVVLRDETDPFNLYGEAGASGAINIIDLSNIYSCSFIATDDLGRTLPDGSFEVLGRMDNSDIRGCSQMVV